MTFNDLLDRGPSMVIYGTLQHDALQYFMAFANRVRKVTVTLEEDVAQWARIEAARRDTSVSRLLGELLKEHMGKPDGRRSIAEAVERLATFGKRHRLSLRRRKIKDLINEGRR